MGKHLRAGLDGPSRTIIVEPVREPPKPPVRAPEPEPRPEREPEKVPATAGARPSPAASSPTICD